MEDRFLRMSKLKCRNIHDYNAKVSENNKMKPVVMIVDEWADIVLQNKAIQKPLCVVAQKGRAAGISIVLATQRPSASVISGLIKANFSGRIALKVASKIDSRIILDQPGAEKITGIGVGLYVDHKSSDSQMFRAPYIQSPTEDLEHLVSLMPKEKKQKSFWQMLWQ